MIFQFARDAYYRTNIYNRMLRRHGPAQIYGLRTDPIPGDPARGAGMLDGAMVLAARRRMLGDHIFENDLRSTAALTDLYGFSWLRDLSALSAPGSDPEAWTSTRKDTASVRSSAESTPVNVAVNRIVTVRREETAIDRPSGRSVG